MNKEQDWDQSPDSRLDITAETCPMTFVRTRLALDRLDPGQVLEVLIRGEEPRRNLPRTAVEQGHALLGMVEDGDGRLRLRLRRGGG
jgi:TusA-related sulfurtransferase